LKKLAAETYPELLKKELPKTWEELEMIDGYYVDLTATVNRCYNFSTRKSNSNFFKTKEQAEASIALAQLSQLKAVYNGDWVVDWRNNKQGKHSIIFYNDEIHFVTYKVTPQFLTLKDRQTAQLFLENFRDLIIKAKPLFS